MTNGNPDDPSLDMPLEPVEYPPGIQTVGELLERAIRLAGLDPDEVLGRETD